MLFCRYSYENGPIQKELSALEVGNSAAFLLSPLASAITGQVGGWVGGWVPLVVK
jgi:enoyl-[acyl-carrier-protein] reductase (NADH)